MKTRCTILLFLVVMASSGQRYFNSLDSSGLNIQWGPYIYDVTQSTCIGFIGEIDKNIYSLRSNRKSMWSTQTVGINLRLKESTSYFIDKLNQQMNLVYSAKLELNYQGEPSQLERVLVFGNRLFVVSSQISWPMYRKYVFYQELDLNSLQPISGQVKIGEMLFNPDAPSKKNKMLFEFSPDSTKLLILFDQFYNIPGHEHFNLLVFDSEFGIKQRKEVDLPYEEKLFDVKKIRLDNSGSIYVLGKLYRNSIRERKKGEVNYSIVLLKYRPEESEPVVYNIDSGNIYLREVSVVLKEREVVLIGFYYTNKKARLNGCLVASIDSQTDEITYSKLDFGFRQFSDIYERGIVERSDGSIVLLAEEYEIESGGTYFIRAQTPQSITSTVSADSPIGALAKALFQDYEFNYKSIYVFSLSSEYDLEWIVQISKAQVTFNDSGFYSSFYVLPVGEKLIFFYNDYTYIPSKRGIVPDTFESLLDDSMAVCRIVDRDGKAQAYTMFYTKDEQLFLRPKAFGKTAQSTLLMFAQHHNLQRYGKVILNE